jgi:hypothetical protein
MVVVILRKLVVKLVVSYSKILWLIVYDDFESLDKYHHRLLTFRYCGDIFHGFEHLPHSLSLLSIITILPVPPTLNRL